jgi:mono/diheme cytochrome c family protein
LVFVVLLIAGSLAINAYLKPAVTKGPYIPTITDPTQGLYFLGGIAGGLVVLLGLGVALRVAVPRLGGAVTQLEKQEAAVAAAKAAAAKAEGKPAAKPTPAAKAPELPVPFTSHRSISFFFVAVLALGIGLQVPRYLVSSIGYIPGLQQTLGAPTFFNAQLFSLGDFKVLEWQVLLAVLGGTVVATVGAGVGLAQGFRQLDQTHKGADKLPKDTFVDRLIPQLEKHIAAMREPRPFKPANPFEQFFVGLFAVFLVTIVVITLTYILPAFQGSVLMVDNALKATEIASRATPTPSPVPGQSPAALAQKAFEALPAGDVAAGEIVYTKAICVTCHSLDGAVLVGPSLQGVATHAATRKPGYSAQAYLYESIISPSAYIVPDQPSFGNGGVSLMPPTFKDTLTAQELADVIAFLMTQK